MPLHIQPKSLQATSLVNVTNLIIKSCVNIQLRFGSYDYYPCQEAVSDLQNYLLPKVRPFLDCICDNASHDDLRELDDKRIFYSLVVHRKTKLLNLNSLLSRCSANYKCFQGFCIDQISKLDNLVSLYISQWNISGNVLKTIADTCFMSLQELTITPVLTEFSDGVAYLSKCKELRYLKILTFVPDNSLESLRLLILSLPKLEFFDSGYMIEILSGVEVVNPLSLTKLKEIDTNSHDISHVMKICPKLVDIDIAVASYSFEGKTTILNAIASSSLLLTSLTLRGFVYNSGIDNLLTTKGASLMNITIGYNFPVVNSVNLYIIGKYCPNLKKLDLDFPDIVLDYGALANHTETGAATLPMFTKLESLCFGWYKVKSDGDSILPLILRDANQISVLKLQCSTSLSNQDALSELLCSNPLLMLTELSLIVNGHGTISHQSLSYLIDRCQRLRECYIYSGIRRETYAFLQKLYGRIQDENLDLRFDVFGR